MSRRPRVHGLDDSCDEASHLREDLLVSHFHAFERQRMPSSLVFRSLHAVDIASHLDPEPRGKAVEVDDPSAHQMLRTHARPRPLAAQHSPECLLGQPVGRRELPA